jgi:tetratricopeptide (TPR) repeat protein
MIRGWLLLSMLISADSLSAADQIVRRSDGTVIRGELTEMGGESVTVRMSGGKSETVSVADIRSVQFDREPALLAQARSNEQSGVLDAALQKYEQTAEEAGGSDKRLTAELQFLMARVRVRMALADSAMQESAMKSIQNFRTSHPSNFRYLEATLLQATLTAELKDRAAAEKLLEEVRRSSVRGFQLQAGVQLGRHQLQAGDAVSALSSFEQVIKECGDDPTTRAAMFDGMLGRALCLQSQMKFEEAVVALDEVIAKAAESDNSRVLAEAWNHKGDCLVRMNRSKAALMAYLHVDVLYPSEPAEHAEALFRLSKLWESTGHPDRASDAAARLTEKYPHSTWAGN